MYSKPLPGSCPSLVQCVECATTRGASLQAGATAFASRPAGSGSLAAHDISDSAVLTRHAARQWRCEDGDEERPADDEGGLALQESKPELKRPPLYKVILLNDDYTPMEFVVEVLEVFFRMNREQATQVMLTVHTQGKGVCGVYTKDIAETKAAQVNQYARDHQHPLLCEIEASDG